MTGINKESTLYPLSSENIEVYNTTIRKAMDKTTNSNTQCVARIIEYIKTLNTMKQQTYDRTLQNILEIKLMIDNEQDVLKNTKHLLATMKKMMIDDSQDTVVFSTTIVSVEKFMAQARRDEDLMIESLHAATEIHNKFDYDNQLFFLSMQNLSQSAQTIPAALVTTVAMEKPAAPLECLKAAVPKTAGGNYFKTTHINAIKRSCKILETTDDIANITSTDINTIPESFESCISRLTEKQNVCAEYINKLEKLLTSTRAFNKMYNTHLPPSIPQRHRVVVVDAKQKNPKREKTIKTSSTIK